MKGKIAIIPMILCLVLGIFGGIAIDRAVAPDVIAGQVFFDAKESDGLDWYERNYELDWADIPAVGVKIEALHLESRLTLYTTTDENGMYRFYPPEKGTYSIRALFDSPECPFDFNSVSYLCGGNVEVAEEKLVLGPTILLSQTVITKPVASKGGVLGPVMVKVIEAPDPGSAPKGLTYCWTYQIVNQTNDPIEMIYSLECPKSGYPGAVVLDPDGSGPIKDFFYSSGQKALLKGGGEHILYLSLVLPEGMDPAELELTFGMYYGPMG